MKKVKFMGIVTGIMLFTGAGFVATMDNNESSVAEANTVYHLKANEGLSYYKLDNTEYYVNENGKPIANPFKAKEYAVVTYEGYTKLSDGYTVHKYKDAETGKSYFMGTSVGVKEVSYEEAVQLLDLAKTKSIARTTEMYDVNPIHGDYGSQKVKADTTCKVLGVEQSKDELVVKVDVAGEEGYVSINSLLK